MKRTIFFLFILSTAFTLKAQTPNFEWVKSNQGYQGNVYTNSMKVDTFGNIYTTGSFFGTVDFNPSPNHTTILSSINNMNSYYIQKLNSNGNLVWVRTVNFEYGGFGIKGIDHTGSLYIIGNFKDTVDIDPGPTVYNLVSQGEKDICILKLSANGNFIWAKSFGGSEDDVIGDICLDNQSNLYSHGYFTGTADFDPGIGTSYLNSIASNTESAFVQKLDNNGNFVWARAFVALDTLSGLSNGKFIDLDSYGNIYCAGYFQGPIDFDPGSGSNIPPSNAMGEYIVKLDSLGDFFWLNYTSYVSSWGICNVNSIKVDRYNNIYTTGTFGGNVDFDPGPDTLLLSSSTFIQKFDENGNFLWAKSYGFGDNPNSITTDTFGNVYSTGQFKDSTDLAPGQDTMVFYTYSPFSHGYGAYLQKLNSKGDLLWAGVLQGNLGGSSGLDITVDNAGNIFTVGDYGGTVDFDPGSGSFNQTPQNNKTASYILKLSQCKVLATDYVTTCDSLTWIDGITYHQPTQSAYYTLPSSTGCDSIICLSLDIPQLNTTVSISPHGVFSSNQNLASYQWLDCNNGFAPLIGDTLQSYTPAINGDYAVEINNGGCIDTSACTHIGNVSIEEIEGNTIKLYPNPNSGKFMLDLSKLKATEVRILNSLGQEMWVVRDINSQYFDLDLNPGIYFAEIRTEKDYKVIKFVVRQ